MAKKVDLKITGNILKGLDIGSKGELLEVLSEGVRQVKIKRSLKLYQEGHISFGRAAELAGVRKDELAVEAYARGIEPATSKETLQEETS